MQQAALSRRERQIEQMKQTTITAVLTEIVGNKGKTAQYYSCNRTSNQENAPKGARKKDKKVPAKLCAEEACLLCHDEGTYSKKNSLA